MRKFYSKSQKKASPHVEGLSLRRLRHRFSAVLPLATYGHSVWLGSSQEGSAPASSDRSFGALLREVRSPACAQDCGARREPLRPRPSFLILPLRTRPLALFPVFSAATEPAPHPSTGLVRSPCCFPSSGRALHAESARAFRAVEACCVDAATRRYFAEQHRERSEPFTCTQRITLELARPGACRGAMRLCAPSLWVSR